VLTKRLRDMQSELAQISDPEKALRMLQRERMQAARERREQTKRQHAQRRFEKHMRYGSAARPTLIT
jgi:hypothetical protein